MPELVVLFLRLVTIIDLFYFADYEFQRWMDGPPILPARFFLARIEFLPLPDSIRTAAMDSSS
jgi:hypothetical protein